MRWYGLMYLLAFGVGWLGTRVRARRPWSPMAPAQVDDLVFYCMLGTILGGRFGYVLFYDLSTFVREPWKVFFIWEGGMSFHGGLLGVLIAMVLFARRLKQPFFAVTDFLAPWAAPGLGFVRIGNFINGELWGVPTRPDAWWAVWVDGVPRHATQLYQAVLEGLVLFLVLWLYSLRPRPLMAVSGLFLLLYGLFRIAVEFLRMPDEHLGYIAFGWLTMGQILTAPMVIAGAVLLWLAHRRRITARARA